MDGSGPLRISSIGRDINLEILRVEGYRKFCNKVFNATKFAMLKLDQDFVPGVASKVRNCRCMFSDLNRSLAHRKRGPCGKVDPRSIERRGRRGQQTADREEFLDGNKRSVQLLALRVVRRIHRESFFRLSFTVPHQTTGSDETYDRRIRFRCDEEVRTTNSIHLFGLRSETTSPFYALRDGRIMATLAKDPERHHPLHHGVQIPRICECEKHHLFPRMSHRSTQDKDFVFEDAVNEFNLTFSAVKTGRSLAASYSLQNDIQCRRYPMDPRYTIVADCLQCSFRFNRIRKPNCSNHKHPRSSR